MEEQRVCIAQKLLKALLTSAKVLAIVFCLYCFICSLEILSTAFKLLAGQAMGKFILFTICIQLFVYEVMTRMLNFQVTSSTEVGWTILWLV